MSGLARVIWSHGALVALACWTLGAISSCGGGESSDPSRSVMATSDPSTFLFADELDPDTWSGSGRLCGTSFEWAARSDTYQETGTWTFSDASNFNKVSDYSYFDGGGGTCTGEGSSSMSPPAPAPIPSACP